ncbi:N-acetylmuramoyl-L-alanine amidase [Bernardetia litoralis DSM 6794]|uniref:N-acetylmuramoyl-L-alanine amidase n=1 Tax=Bernardetia litoralis (strain ATCC 23117 / DSM 6794 / NBRC 15988 / NCIMB 1366 / Fx l1 / Sio-4) TaxID=880071 RepID=I4AJ00_BERLS|nr:N-acetylmuramoyl-L-alanine amidase [Bernardetia litoralis]AFM03935.1 N-acetylmuramoyl-L-alanine amidase [Bernardetia litoralis DSM 6794]
MKYHYFSDIKSLVLSSLFLFIFFIGSSFLSLDNQTKKPLFVVVVDAGHGGNDVGNECSDLKRFKQEKDLVLPVALQLGGYLENLLENVKVIYTRTEDRYVSLEDRAKIANEASADLFISIHANHNPIKSIHGSQVHIHNHDIKFSKIFAQKLLYQLSKRAKRKVLKIQTTADRGHNLFVLQNTKMPAVLVELGFMSNKNEEVYLNSEYGQTILASAIFRAVREYRGVVQ